ncbi:hypothetical protein H4I95_09586 [Botrytis cinerea]
MSDSGNPSTDILPSGNSSLFSNLPTELKCRVVDLLVAKDVVNLRLTSRTWSGVSVTGLFNVSNGNHIEHGVFSIRPHLDDMTRLRSVAGSTWLAKVIRHVKIYVGDLDMLEFDHEVQTVNRYTKIESMLTCERKVNTLLEQIVQNRMKHCDVLMLSHSLSKLPSVKSVTATANECPFSASDVNFTLAWMRLMRRWNREPDALYDSYDTTFPTRSTIRHLSILLATRLLQQPVRNLVLDTFPIDLFASQSFDDDDDQTGPSYEIHTSFLHDMEDMISKVEHFRIGINSLGNNATTQEHTRVIAKSMRHGFFLVPHDKPRGCVSIKSILFKLRDGLKLERFQLLVSASDRQIYDQDWQVVKSSAHKLPDAKLFEMFVLGKWSWPMVNVDYPHWRRMDEWKGWVRRDGWDKLKSKSKRDIKELDW